VILPVQKRALRQWVADALAEAGKPIPLDRIVNGNIDADVQRPAVQIIWPGSTRRGPAPERRTIGDPGSEEHWSRTDGTATVSITVIGVPNRLSYDDDADAYTVELLALVNDHDLGAQLDAVGLGVAGVTHLPNLDALTGQSQWETRAALDITFNTAIIVTSTPGIVQTAVVDGTTEPPTPIGEFEVTTAP
jgi:hypothetical protein